MERRIKHWWRRELGLAKWCTPEQMPRTGGWTETVGDQLIDGALCIERIRAERGILSDQQA